MSWMACSQSWWWDIILLFLVHQNCSDHLSVKVWFNVSKSLKNLKYLIFLCHKAPVLSNKAALFESQYHEHDHCSICQQLQCPAVQTTLKCRCCSCYKNVKQMNAHWISVTYWYNYMFQPQMIFFKASSMLVSDWILCTHISHRPPHNNNPHCIHIFSTKHQKNSSWALQLLAYVMKIQLISYTHCIIQRSEVVK